MEELTTLIPDRLYLIQDSDFFKFGNDSVFLANFTRVRTGDIVVDLGTGSGVIPLLLAFKQNPGKIIGVEIQKKLVEMAKRSVELNNYQDIIDIKEANFKESSTFIKPSSVDLVVSNPPYMPVDRGKITLGEEKAIARHEIYGTLEDLIREASRILRFAGKFAMVHKAARLAEIIALMTKNNLEAKRLRLVQSRKNNPAKIVLIEAQKGAKPGLVIEPVLLVYKEDSGAYTEEVQEIYGEDSYD
ncbi:tRNA1(Val) (adenine(37)-N6)-methyltransferase [Natronospora cellulosivora (SeqCode)]